MTDITSNALNFQHQFYIADAPNSSQAKLHDGLNSNNRPADMCECYGAVVVKVIVNCKTF